MKVYQSLKEQIVCDYKNKFGILVLECVGTISSLGAAFTLAFVGKDVNLAWILTFYLIGSAAWAIASLIRSNSFNLLLSSCYTVINIIGLLKIYLEK